jgi:sec-independent protein translocase protein TatA
MGKFGWMEILLLGLILVVLFGATKLPQIGRGMGEGIKEFKKAIKGDEGEARGNSDKKAN